MKAWYFLVAALFFFGEHDGKAVAATATATKSHNRNFGAQGFVIVSTVLGRWGPRPPPCIITSPQGGLLRLRGDTSRGGIPLGYGRRHILGLRGVGCGGLPGGFLYPAQGEYEFQAATAAVAH